MEGGTHTIVWDQNVKLELTVGNYGTYLPSFTVSFGLSNLV